MSIVTAKAFRQQIMKPAEGLFLFHARAIERLIADQLGERLAGVSVPDLPYYLMPRAEFLLGLETENAEALSVIEGLKLPAQVILLPSPPNQRLEQRSLDRLSYDYWARSFEAEIARSWQAARDCGDDGAALGADSLRELIGQRALGEVRDVLAQDGLILPVWDDELVTRTFVACVVKLRYFAPGARGFCFPAIEDWPRVDAWMSSGGLDLPRPLVDPRLPRLLLKTRPDGVRGLREHLPVLPFALPYGASDPDLAQVVALATGAAERPRAPTEDDAAVAGNAVDDLPAAVGAERRDADGPLVRRCVDAIVRGSMPERRLGWRERLIDQLGIWRTQLTGLLRWVPAMIPAALRRARHAAVEAELARHVADEHADLLLLECATSAAIRAQHRGFLALALRRFAACRRVAQRLTGVEDTLPAAVEQALSEREAVVESLLSSGLAGRWSLDAATEAELRAMIQRLAGDDGAAAAQGLLSALEQLCLRAPNDYYRLRIGRWLMHLGREVVRERLPFQPLLQALRAIEICRSRLEELRWPIMALERFSQVLNALEQRVAEHLETELGPRVEQAMREANFVPRNHRENVAARKMKLELLDVIRHRRHLKFTDVRDIVARNILRLPDPTWSEFFRGDRLRCFDRTAERALPGVYRPGEMYIKGLQQLGAPLFGTPIGRDILGFLLLPFGGAYLVLKSIDLLLELMPFVDQGFHLTEPVSVLFSGALINLVANTGIGRHLAIAIGVGIWRILRFLLWDGPRSLTRWWPIAGLLSTGLIRGLARTVVQPLLIGTLPLMPIIALAVLVDEVPVEPGLWLLGLAFALGTLARNTPAGRRFLDNMSTRVGIYLQRINQALFIGLIQQLLYFFKEVTRRFSQVLHRVDETLTHRRSEHWTSLAAKALLAPVWRLFEAFIQFYVTVLVEPQVNPVKHFPIVTVGHKLLLPFLPAITAAFVDVTASVMPKVIAYPFVTLTIILLPGLFGFLVWELKENWKLYEANHRHRLGARDDAGEADTQVEPARVGAHGESMRGLLWRGFHSGTLPKGFDRMRKVFRDQLRDDRAHRKRVRRCQRQLQEVERSIEAFVDREFSFALQDRCRSQDCRLERIETRAPHLATELVEIAIALYPRASTAGDAAQATAGAEGAQRQPTADTGEDSPSAGPVLLALRITLDGRRLRFDTELRAAPERIGRRCWAAVSDDLRLFAGRAGANLRKLEIDLPASAARPTAPG